jgi:hypothetical protein
MREGAHGKFPERRYSISMRNPNMVHGEYHTNFGRSIRQTVQCSGFSTRWLLFPIPSAGYRPETRDKQTFPTSPISGSLGILQMLRIEDYIQQWIVTINPGSQPIKMHLEK